jgi:hypothetical protein
VEQRKQARGWHQHFIGSWARLNCENMPVLPAWLVRANLDDPRRIPYLFVWKRESDGKIMEVVRLARYEGDDNYVDIKRTNGDYTVLRIVWRMLPRNGGRALLLHCFLCNTPRRHVYGWEWDSFSGWSNRVRSISWRCRSCARLRYSSEGGALVSRGGPISRLLRMPCPDMRHPRPEPWLPYVFESIDDPRLDEIVRVNRPPDVAAL